MSTPECFDIRTSSLPAQWPSASVTTTWGASSGAALGMGAAIAGQVSGGTSTGSSFSLDSAAGLAAQQEAAQLQAQVAFTYGDGKYLQEENTKLRADFLEAKVLVEKLTKELKKLNEDPFETWKRKVLNAI